MMKEMLAMKVEPGGKVYNVLEVLEVMEVLEELEELLEVLGRLTEVVAVEV